MNRLSTRRNKRATVRFNLEYSKYAKTPVPIYLIYRYKKDENGRRVPLKYSVGKKIYKSAWDPKAMRVKVGVRMNQLEADSINDVLVRLERHCYQLCGKNPEISIPHMKDELDFELGVKSRPKLKTDYTVLEYFDQFIKKSNLNPRTIQKFEGVFNHLKRFQKHRDVDFGFDMMKPEFVEGFSSYLYEKRGSSVNTVSKIVNVLKQVVHDAFINGYHTNASYQGKELKVGRMETSKHFLR